MPVEAKAPPARKETAAPRTAISQKESQWCSNSITVQLAYSVAIDLELYGSVRRA